MRYQASQLTTAQTKERKLSDFFIARIVLALTIALSLFVSSFLLYQQPAQAKDLLSYNCSNSHCYGLSEWISAKPELLVTFL